MTATDVSPSRGEVTQRPRFGPLRAVPPGEAVALLGGVPPTAWTTSWIGGEGGYPNGGLWRVEADPARPTGPTALVVKRTGAAHLGTFPVWRGRAEREDPQWWGREAEFYRSDLAESGWPSDVRVARCHVDDHDGCRDLWLEEVFDIPAPLEVCRRAVIGLAHWQVANQHSDHAWLSTGWIAKHVARQGLDNARTLGHPGWSAAIDRGLDPELRELVLTRRTDPLEVEAELSIFPAALTNHDLHSANIGTIGDQVVLIDWAYVGWGPIGHDVGHLASSLEPVLSTDLAEAWEVLATAYCDALVTAGWTGDLGVVRRSMAVSNQLRLSWSIDALLTAAEHLGDEELLAHSQRLTALGRLG